MPRMNTSVDFLGCSLTTQGAVAAMGVGKWMSEKIKTYGRKLTDGDTSSNWSGLDGGCSVVVGDAKDRSGDGLVATIGVTPPTLA